MVHGYEDGITVLGKRIGEEVEKLAEGYLKTLGEPAESSAAHASSGSAPLGPDHGPAHVMEEPPNPASSTANQGLLMEPFSPTSAVPLVHEVEGGSVHAGLPVQVPPDHVLTVAHTPQPGPNPMPSTDNFAWNYQPKVDDPPSKPKFDWNTLKNLKSQLSPGPASSQSSDQKPSTGFNWQKLKKLKDQLSPGPASSQTSDPKPSTGSTFNWKKLKDTISGPMKDQPPPGAASSQTSDPKPSTFNWNNLKNLKGTLSGPLKDQPQTGPLSSQLPTSIPKPSTMSKLSGYADNVIDFLGKLDPLPRPLPKPPTPDLWETWIPPSEIAGPSKPVDPNLMSQKPGPLKINEKELVIDDGPLPSLDHQSSSSSTQHQPSDPAAAAAYEAKGKAIDTSAVSFFLVPQSSA